MRWIEAGAVGLISVVAAACSIQERTDRATVQPSEADESSASEFIRPWGDADAPRGVRSGDLVWIWGMPGVVPGAAPPRLVAGGAGSEARQALSNVSDVLEAVGAELRDVGQCSVFLADAADSTAVASAYLEYFPSPPTRTAVATRPLALGARVEIECTAVVSGGA